MSDDTEDPLTRTGVLKAEFGRAWRFWHWLAKQFSTTSLGVLGVVISVASGYIIHLNGKVSAQEQKVTILETKVVPVLQGGEKVAELRADMAGLQSTVIAHESRLNRIERNVDLDYNEEQQKRSEAKKRVRK